MDTSFIILLNINRFYVHPFRYKNFCQHYFLYVVDLEGINYKLLEELDYDKIECLFFKQYNDEDIIFIIYYLLLQSFLG